MSTRTSHSQRDKALAASTSRDSGAYRGISVVAARRIAEQAHEGQMDASGESYIDHVSRVAAGVPSFARAVAWLHDVTERSDVDESLLIEEGANPDQCLALRLLSRDTGQLSDEPYLAHVRSIALSAGLAGHIARAVKRADLLDHLLHPPRGSARWRPPYGAAFAVLMKMTSNSARSAERAPAGSGSGGGH